MDFSPLARPSSARQSAVEGSLSYADCFAAALAKISNCELLTGDPEFKSIEKEINVHWLTATRR
jgi:predicted nucleic acid-binding protein